MFESEELESYWITYSDNFNKKFGSSKGSLIKFKKFINDEPSKDVVLKRISLSINNFDENIASTNIYKLLKYIHYDYFVNFDKFISQTEQYRKKYTNNKDDEVFYNKLALLRTMTDGENFLKIFTKFYDYYINAVSSVYEIIHNRKPENKKEILDSFLELYDRIDINIKIYHYDFCLEIFSMLNKSLTVIISAIYSDQSGCCVATPTFNILDIMIQLLRNLRKVIPEIL